MNRCPGRRPADPGAGRPASPPSDASAPSAAPGSRRRRTGSRPRSSIRVSDMTCSWWHPGGPGAVTSRRASMRHGRTPVSAPRAVSAGPAPARRCSTPSAAAAMRLKPRWAKMRHAEPAGATGQPPEHQPEREQRRELQQLEVGDGEERGGADRGHRSARTAARRALGEAAEEELLGDRARRCRRSRTGRRCRTGRWPGR